MSSESDDLKATAEDMIDDSRRVEELEQQKLRLDPADPRFAELARQIEQLVAQMANKARAQQEIAAEASEEAAGA